MLHLIVMGGCNCPLFMGIGQDFIALLSFLLFHPRKVSHLFVFSLLGHTLCSLLSVSASAVNPR